MVCCLFQTSTSNSYSRGTSSNCYQVHHQRAPDPCGPIFKLVTGYTSILDSRSQTSTLQWQRPRTRASHTEFGGIVDTSSSRAFSRRSPLVWRKRRGDRRHLLCFCHGHACRSLIGFAWCSRHDCLFFWRCMFSCVVRVPINKIFMWDWVVLFIKGGMI